MRLFRFQRARERTIHACVAIINKFAAVYVCRIDFQRRDSSWLVDAFCNHHQALLAPYHISLTFWGEVQSEVLFHEFFDTTTVLYFKDQLMESEQDYAHHVTFLTTQFILISYLREVEICSAFYV